MKVKIFVCTSADELESEANEWLKKAGEIVVEHMEHSVSTMGMLDGNGAWFGLVSLAIGYRRARVGEVHHAS
jgi:hypothetical protein